MLSLNPLKVSKSILVVNNNQITWVILAIIIKLIENSYQIFVLLLITNKTKVLN